MNREKRRILNRSLLILLCLTAVGGGWSASLWADAAEKTSSLESNRERWNKLSPEKKEAVLRNYEKWKSYAPEKKEGVLRNYDKWKSYSPEKKELILKRYERIQALPSEKRMAAVERLKALRESRAPRMDTRSPVLEKREERSLGKEHSLLNKEIMNMRG